MTPHSRTTRPRPSNLLSVGEEEVGRPVFDMPAFTKSPSGELFVLLVYATGGYTRRQPAGLVLAPVGEDKAIFKRVGYTSIRDGSSVFQRPDARALFWEVEPQTLYLM